MEKILHISKEVPEENGSNLQNGDNFIRRLQTRYSLLRKSEKRIADYLRQNSQQRLDMSITEFAKFLDVSEATVSRFCRAVGFRGFQDLKLSLATSISITEEFQNIPQDIHQTDSTTEIGKKLADTLSGAIAETQRSLRIDDIDAAIDALAHARHITLYGIGGSSIIVYAAHHLFAKAGLSCSVYVDGYMQTVTASMMNSEGVALGVSNTGMSKHVVDALEIAASRGATTIGITSNRDSALARTSTICLVTPSGRRDVPLYGGSIEAKICQLYILDLLYLGILFKLGNLTKKNLKETANALRTYYNPINYDMKSSN